MTIEASPAPVDLSALAVWAKELVVVHGLLLVDAEFASKADVALDNASTSIDEAVAVAVASGAPFVSLQADTFSTVKLRELLAPEGGEELPTKVQRFITRARTHDGESDALWLRWVAQGLIFQWVATPAWRDELFENLDRELASARRAAETESSKNDYAQKARIKELAAVLITSKEFRGVAANKRRPVGHAVLGASASGEIDPYIAERAISEAGGVMDRNSYEYEVKFGSQTQDLADELRGHHEWRTATTAIRRREVTQLFLAEKADGYRIGPRVVQPVFEAAKNGPVNMR
jgi:hypothetical protein